MIRLFSVDEKVKLIHTEEPGKVLMIDHQHEQVELEFKDGSCAVYQFNQIEKVNE